MSHALAKLKMHKNGKSAELPSPHLRIINVLGNQELCYSLTRFKLFKANYLRQITKYLIDI